MLPLRVGSKKPKGLAFEKSFFHARSVTGGEMRVLKCLSRFKVRTDVKDYDCRIVAIFNSIILHSIVYICIQ